MSSETIANKSFGQLRPKPRMGVVTGAQEISAVEAMIQRYLELAASALKPANVEAHNPK